MPLPHRRGRWRMIRLTKVRRFVFCICCVATPTRCFIKTCKCALESQLPMMDSIHVLLNFGCLFFRPQLESTSFAFFTSGQRKFSFLPHTFPLSPFQVLTAFAKRDYRCSFRSRLMCETEPRSLSILVRSLCICLIMTFDVFHCREQSGSIICPTTGNNRKRTSTARTAA